MVNTDRVYQQFRIIRDKGENATDISYNKRFLDEFIRIQCLQLVLGDVFDNDKVVFDGGSRNDSIRSRL